MEESSKREKIKGQWKWQIRWIMKKISTGIELTFELFKARKRMGGKERFSSGPRYLKS